MKIKSKKSALLLSFTSLLLCFAMLAGSTFAWFTDTATTGVNKIVSGTLDVGLEMAIEWDSEGKPTKWANAEGKTLEWQKKATADAEAEAQILWEPGCTYKLPELRVVNNGNLALKYKVVITGIQGDAKLNKVIKWTIDDAPISLVEKELLAKKQGDAFTIKGHMDENAGNEYQNLTIDGISITVYATQLNSEFDSFNNTYDKDAEYVMRNATIMSETDGKTFTLEAGKTYTVGSATVKVSANGDITYTNTNGTAQTVTINTEGGKLTVNAPNDTVNHHGEAEFVEITAIAGNSYHEFGKVSVLAITEGRAVIENGNNAAITQLKGENALVVVRESVTLETKLESNAQNGQVGVIDADGNAIEGKTFKVNADVENVPAELEEVLGSGKTVGEAKDYVAMIGTDGYESLAAAVAAAQDGATVKLLKDCSGNGIKIATAKFATKGLTVDFSGHSYTVGGVLVGSATTGTNAFQLLQGNKVTFQNGSIIGVAENTKPAEDTPDWHGAPAIVIQNYCDLTLKRMTVKGGDETVYTMSNNNGNVVIEDSTIIAGLAKGTRYDPIAFDVCRYDDYPSVSVTVKGNSVIEGDVEVSGEIGEGQSRQLTIENGTFNGTFKVADAPANITIIGGSFTDLANAIKYAADGATIKLAADVEGAGLMTEDKDKAPYRKEITIDFNGHTYTAKNPGVGSKGTESQAMHWGASVGAVTLKNGSFIVKQGAFQIRMAMQNYVNFTAENMVFDFTKIPVVNYDQDEFTGANAKYNGKECPMFNNNLDLDSAYTMTLKNCTLDFPEDSSFAGIISGVLTLDNTVFNGYLGFNAADGKIILSNGSAIKDNMVKDYFDNLTITEADGVWTAVDRVA